MFIVRVLVGSFVLWFFVLLSILVHETGHMVGYQFGKKKCDWFIWIGSGKRIFKIRRLHIHALPFSGCFCMPDEFSFDRKRECLMMIAGGPVFSLLAVIVLFVLEKRFFAGVLSKDLENYKDLLLFVRNCNIFLFLFSALPLRYPAFFGMGEGSDGLNFWKVWREE